jgi:hypothetical protein
MSAQIQSSPNEELPLDGDMIISNATFISEITDDVVNKKEEDNIIPDADKKEEDTNLDNEVDALNNNKVDVEIEPDVKSNDVVVQICSCSVALNCFSWKFGK